MQTQLSTINYPDEDSTMIVPLHDSIPCGECHSVSGFHSENDIPQMESYGGMRVILKMCVRTQVLDWNPWMGFHSANEIQLWD